MPFAKETLANYMTETVRDVVRSAGRGNKNERLPKLRSAAYDDRTFTSADAVRCHDVLEYLDHVDWLHAVRKGDEAVEALREPARVVPEVLPRPHRFSRSARQTWAQQQAKNARRVPLQVDDVDQWRRLIDMAVPMFYRDLVDVLASAKAK